MRECSLACTRPRIGHRSWMWWHTPIISALEAQKQEDQKFNVILRYLECSGSTWTKDSIIKEKERERKGGDRGKEEEGLRTGRREKENPPIHT